MQAAAVFVCRFVLTEHGEHGCETLLPEPLRSQVLHAMDPAAQLNLQTVATQMEDLRQGRDRAVKRCLASIAASYVLTSEHVAAVLTLSLIHI